MIILFFFYDMQVDTLSINDSIRNTHSKDYDIIPYILLIFQ